MTNEEAIEILENIELPTIEQGQAVSMAITVLEQQPITWIVGKDNCQVAVRNMPTDKMQKICAIIGEEEQQPCEDMRDATEEERKSTKDYIDSISKPTGLQFDDIYEELDFVQPHKKTSVNLQPCEDCVSRTDVLKLMCEKCPVYNCITGCQSYRSIEKMPSVTLKTESEDKE